MSEETEVVGHEEPVVKPEARSEAGLSLNLGEQEKILENLAHYSKSIDTKVDTLVSVLEAAGALSEGAFDAALDERRGLRILGEDEVVKDGDVAWVSYVARIAGRSIAEENNMPVRVGSGAVAFEEGLIGKKAYQKGVTYQAEFKDRSFPKWVGKDIQFSIDIGKVKTKLEATVGH